MPPSQWDTLPDEISRFLRIRYRNIGAFIEIQSKTTEALIWCDPWWVKKYRMVKDEVERETKIPALLAEDSNEKLSAILVTHTHGDHFADVPEIFLQCLERDDPPEVFGGRNCQALICDYLAHHLQAPNGYQFYSHFDNKTPGKKFLCRELTYYGDTSNEEFRKNFGLVWNLEDLDGPIELLSATRSRSEPDDFKLLLHWIPFIHAGYSDDSDDSDDSVDGAAPVNAPHEDIAVSPSRRKTICTSWNEKRCPHYKLFGFIYEIRPTYTGTPVFFCFLPSDKIEAGISLPYKEKISLVYYVPKASDLLQNQEALNWPNLKKKIPFHSVDWCDQ